MRRERICALLNLKLTKLNQEVKFSLCYFEILIKINYNTHSIIDESEFDVWIMVYFQGIYFLCISFKLWWLCRWSVCECLVKWKIITSTVNYVYYLHLQLRIKNIQPCRATRKRNINRLNGLNDSYDLWKWTLVNLILTVFGKFYLIPYEPLVSTEHTSLLH